MRLLWLADSGRRASNPGVGEEPLLRYGLRAEGEGMTAVKNTLEEASLADASEEVSMLHEALSYAGDGIHVFPVNEKKAPYSEHGFKDATTNANRIVEWWTQWPDAGIGMPTGRVSGRVVLDVDINPGKDGEATLRRWEEVRGALPHTLTVATGGGGDTSTSPTLKARNLLSLGRTYSARASTCGLTEVRRASTFAPRLRR